MRILAVLCLALMLLACNPGDLPADDDTDLGVVTDLLMPKPKAERAKAELLAVVPLYLPAWDARFETGGPIGAHRVQIVASGHPFDHQVRPQEFHFWTYYTDVGRTQVDERIAMTGCITRTPDSMACDVKPQDEARGAVFELCYGDGSLPPGKRVCLPAALFIDLYPPPSR